MFKRDDVLALLRDNKVLGDDIADCVDMDFLKDPKKNPELILDCFILALGKLGYQTENVQQIPVKDMMDDRINHELFPDSYWAHCWIIKRVKHFFHRAGIDIGSESITFGDMVCPTSKRFCLFMGHLSNVLVFKSELDPLLEQVDTKCRDIRDELDAKEKKRLAIEQQIHERRPHQKQILADISNSKAKLKEVQSKNKQDSQNLHKIRKQNKQLEEKSETISSSVSVISQEIKLLEDEIVRLEELVVTNPEEWESNIQKMKDEITQADEHIEWLKEEIPKAQNDLRNIQKYGQDLKILHNNLLKHLSDIKERRLEKAQLEKQQNTINDSIHQEQSQLNNLETELKLLEQEHENKLKICEQNLEKLSETKKENEGQNQELNTIIRGLKSQSKELQAEIQAAEQIKSDIDYQKPRIERRACAYEQELEKANSKLDRLWKNTETDFCEVLTYKTNINK